MPKSKRAKVVALTKVKKKDREWKGALIEKVRRLCSEYANVYTFKYHNMRTDRFKDLREDLKESSVFMLASTKKLQAALGRTPEDEQRPCAHRLPPFLRGPAGLLFTNLSHADVETAFDDFFHEDYARAGARATETVTLPVGPLAGPAGVPLPHTMEHTLRSHGLPSKLNRGVIELQGAHTVCTAGKPLTPHQAALLRHLQIKMAVFRLKLTASLRGLGEDADFQVLHKDGEESGEDAEATEAAAAMDFEDGLPASMMLPEVLPQQ